LNVPYNVLASQERLDILQVRYWQVQYQRTLVQTPVKDRIAKLRDEIAELSEANRVYVEKGKQLPGPAGDHARRLQRLQNILDELKALTDWKKV
jgi:hypothetical protein